MLSERLVLSESFDLMFEKSPSSSDERIPRSYRSRFSSTAGYEYRDHGAVYYYLTGVPNSFSEPDEWYLDRKAGRVYYDGESEEKL